VTTVQTSRLTIRNFVAEDWPGLLALARQHEASEYAAYDHTWPTGEAEIQGVARWFAEGDSFLAVALRATGEFIGFVSLNRAETDDCAEYGLGYRFAAAHQGKGYATEACLAVLERAFGDLAADRVTAGTAAANGPSCGLLARLGMVKTSEGVGSFRNDADGKPIEFLGYSFVLTRDAWQRRAR